MVKSRGHIPVRKCISCGKKRAKGELIRLALDIEGRPVMDLEQNVPGRGAYVCDEPLCLELLRKGLRLDKAFRKDKTSGVKQNISVKVAGK